jgi:hypothetical protein
MLSGNLNCGLGIVSLSGINLGGRKGLMTYGKKFGMYAHCTEQGQ